LKLAQYLPTEQSLTLTVQSNHSQPAFSKRKNASCEIFTVIEKG